MSSRKILLLSSLLLCAAAQAQDVPLVASYPMEPGADAKKLADAGPLHIDGRLTEGASWSQGGHDGKGFSLKLSGTGSGARVEQGKFLNELGSPLSISLWVKPERFAERGTPMFVLTKTSQSWIGRSFGIVIGDNGSLGFESDGGNGNGYSGPLFKIGEWAHVAVTHQAGGDRVLYFNGQEVSRVPAGNQLYNNDEPLVFGVEPGYNGPGGGRTPFKGEIDEARFYSMALTPAQVQADRRGELKFTREARLSDIAPRTQKVTLRLTRFDMPLGFREHFNGTRQNAYKQNGPDAVDFPALTLKIGADEKPLFAAGAEETLILPEKQPPLSLNVFRQPDDIAIAPGAHWLRPLKWVIWGRRQVYTADITARGGGSYELWTFPLKISGAVQNVTLRAEGRTIYEKKWDAPLRSLTLQLPQASYELSVNGKAVPAFQLGLKPLISGAPKYETFAVNMALPGLKIETPTRPEKFPHQKEWDDDQNALAQARAYQVAMAGIDPNKAPLLAAWTMEPDADNGKLLDGATFAEGHRGQAMKFNGDKARVQISVPQNALKQEVTFAAWIKPDAPTGDRSYIVTTRPAWWEGNFPFSFTFGKDGNLGLEGSGGQMNIWAGRVVKLSEWQHVAFTFRAGGQLIVYYNGKEIGRKETPNALTTNNHPLLLGYEEGQKGSPYLNWSGYNGLIDDARLYTAALTPAQILADRDGTLQTRAASNIENPIPALPAFVREVKTMRDYLGIEVPRSPISIYATSLTHGMSGGFRFHSEQGPGFGGGVDNYAKFLADVGFDRVFEQSGNGVMNNPRDANSYESWAAAMARYGVQFGLNHVNLNHPNNAFFAANLPDWHAPKYRDAQLTAQRFARFPNFVGLNIGADNGNYAWYWDWNGPNGEHPWGMAFQTMQKENFAPLPPKFPPGKAHEKPGTMQEFTDYIARYDKTFQDSNTYFAQAMREIDPRLTMTSGSFGSAPGVGARGGYAWGTAPGRAMFAGLQALQSYDWNEQSSSKPLHNVALIDRLKSYYPEKPAWALLDNFHLFFGREAMQRSYAIALTRGLEAIGTSFLANEANAKAYNNPNTIAAQKELFAWIHKFGGVYAKTQPLATVGVLYVNDQALSRPVLKDGTAQDFLRGSHEGKTFEALFLCHQAGYPARIITPEELKRGLPPSMRAVLLVGLNDVDTTWHWYDDLKPALQKFAQSGGRFITDDESVCPLPATKTAMALQAYVINRDLDWTPELLSRNAENAKLLRKAMILLNDPPLVASNSETVWAIPHQTGDVQYVTVVNMATPEGANASAVVKPQTGTLSWNTKLPIYDLRAGRKLSPDEAKTVDLTKDAFALYAVTPTEITAPQVSVAGNMDGFYYATVKIGAGINGVPVQITLKQGDETATLFGASGKPIKLPVSNWPVTNEVTVTELASGLSNSFKELAVVAVTLLNKKPRPPRATLSMSLNSRISPFHVQEENSEALWRFAARKTVPLVIALTPEQQDSGKIMALATKLSEYYAKQGRKSEIRSIAPGDVVLGVQPLSAVQQFPRWQTLDADLILLGTPANNPLLLDQARGFLLPSAAIEGKPNISVSFSPFVGEFQALNIIGSDAAGLASAVAQIIGL